MSGQVSAIVTAAGLSRRMGQCKQLLDLGGKTVLARCLEALLAGGVTDIIVVVGVYGEAVTAEACRYQMQVVINPVLEGDMASSVKAGHAALHPAASGVIVALCDYPLVAATTVATLAAEHRQTPASIVIPSHDGCNGHPTLFPAKILAELAGGGTLRDLVRRDPGRVQRVPVDDPGILLDMDTPEDYQRLRALFAAGDAKISPAP